MRAVITIFLIAILFDLSVGQTVDTATSLHNNTKKQFLPKNSIYAEIFGNSIFYSLNYERIFFPKKRICLSLREGVSYIPGKVMGDFMIPVLTNGILRLTKNSFIEMGLGMMVWT